MLEPCQRCNYLKSAELLDGELRLIGAAGAPSSGAAAVACEQMGYSAAAGGRGGRGGRPGLRRIGDECAGVLYVGWGRCVLRARKICAADVCWARQSCEAACPLGASCCRCALNERQQAAKAA